MPLVVITGRMSIRRVVGKFTVCSIGRILKLRIKDNQAYGIAEVRAAKERLHFAALPVYFFPIAHYNSLPLNIEGERELNVLFVVGLSSS